MEKRKSRRRLLSLLLALFMVLTMGTSSFAASSEEENAAVAACKESVFRVCIGVNDENTGDVLELMTSTAFLINDTHLVTCDHVFAFDDEVYDTIEMFFGYDREKADQQRVEYIRGKRGLVRDVKVVFEKPETDLAVVRMDEPLDNRTPLKIDFNPPEIASPCYALYIDQLIDVTEDPDSIFDTKISSGLVRRLFKSENVDYISHTAKAYSGAPLLNNDGNVIGITTLNIAAEESDEEDLYTAVNVMELVRILDPLMIEYSSTNERTSSDSPDPEPESGQETEQEQETSEYSWIKDLSIFKH